MSYPCWRSAQLVLNLMSMYSKLRPIARPHSATATQYSCRLNSYTPRWSAANCDADTPYTLLISS